ncbi:MAG TPA: glycosyltransferase family 4 protein [Desulfomonilaceae bacterium]|nr:glycosyltransferase family 4 protein [Desulfomonilaceae bacterium]
MGFSKVVHLTSVHRSDDTRIYGRQCRSLAEAGYNVVLVAPDARYQAKEGVRLHSVPAATSRLKRMLLTVYRIYRAAVEENGEIYHLHDPELVGPACLLRMKGKRIIFDFHESFALQVMTKPWVPSSLRALVVGFASLIQKLAVHVSDRVIAATPVVARSLPSQKTSVIMNYPVLKELILESPLPYSQRPPWVGYVGELTEIRGVKEMVGAMDLLPADLQAEFQLMGNFSPAEFEREVASTPGWDRVNFLGYQSRESVARMLGQCRLGLVMLHPTPNYIESYPVKLYEYMAAGLPVVASDFPLWREIIEEVGCGLLADPLDPKSIAKQIQWILSNPAAAERMGQRGRAAALDRFNWDSEIPKLLRVYSQTLQ